VRSKRGATGAPKEKNTGLPAPAERLKRKKEKIIIVNKQKVAKTGETN
jgi:hypothetical protein